MEAGTAGKCLPLRANWKVFFGGPDVDFPPNADGHILSA
jgi:hypothetical protein